VSFRPSVPRLKMASTVARSELSEQFIVALPGASALRSHPSRVPFFLYAREQSGSDGVRKSQRLAILQVADQRAFGFFPLCCSFAPACSC